ncbi:MAG: CYTH domain-containing protein [Oscillospiraceae bacterium]
MSREIERKYLIAMPEEETLARLAAERWDIIQVYLKSPPGVTARVRQVTAGETTRYFYTEKRRLSALSADETEREVTALEYMRYFYQADTELRPIRKRRWRVPYGGHTLEIDVYPFWKTAAVLEVELSEESEAAALPEWIAVLRDVTEDFRFKNVSLARAVPEIGE